MIENEEQIKKDLEIILDWIAWDVHNEGENITSLSAIYHLKKVEDESLVSGFLYSFILKMFDNQSDKIVTSDNTIFSMEDIFYVMGELGIEQLDPEEMIGDIRHYQECKEKYKEKGSMDLVQEFYNLLMELPTTDEEQTLIDHQKEMTDLMKNIDLSKYTDDDIKKTIKIFTGLEEYLICDYLSLYLKNK